MCHQQVGMSRPTFELFSTLFDLQRIAAKSCPNHGLHLQYALATDVGQCKNLRHNAPVSIC